MATAWRATYCPTCQLAVQIFSRVQIWNTISSLIEINVPFVKLKFYCKQFLLSYDIVISYDK